ncbi:MAG: hypothetical protein QOH27_5946, partial [Mycobacterium sp.]|nr:hypothetical protein [Mycobacterium sp.]
MATTEPGTVGTDVILRHIDAESDSVSIQ